MTKVAKTFQGKICLWNIGRLSSKDTDLVLPRPHSAAGSTFGSTTGTLANSPLRVSDFRTLPEVQPRSSRTAVGGATFFAVFLRLRKRHHVRN